MENLALGKLKVTRLTTLRSSSFYQGLPGWFYQVLTKLLSNIHINQNTNPYQPTTDFFKQLILQLSPQTDNLFAWFSGNHGISLSEEIYKKRNDVQITKLFL